MGERDDVRAQWISDLRSGIFQQGQRFLIQWDPKLAAPRYCCIGVYCATNAAGIPESERMAVGIDNLDYDSGYGYTAFERSPHLSDGETNYLAEMNDGASSVVSGRRNTRRRDFAFIARFAEILFALKRMDENA